MLEEIGQPKDIHYHDAIKHGGRRGNERITQATKRHFKIKIGKRFWRRCRIYARIGKEDPQHSW